MEGCQLSLSEAVIHQCGSNTWGGGEREISSYLEIRDITPACLVLTHTCITDQNVILNTKLRPETHPLGLDLDLLE